MKKIVFGLLVLAAFAGSQGSAMACGMDKGGSAEEAKTEAKA